MPCIGRTVSASRNDLGRHQTMLINAEAEKRTGWRGHRILVLAEHDPHLAWPERELARQLGAMLPGRRSEVPHG